MHITACKVSDAANALPDRAAHLSSRSRGNAYSGLTVIAIILGCVGLLIPELLLVTAYRVILGLFLVMIIYRGALVAIAWSVAVEPIPQRPPTRFLPVYTVLIPLYREAPSVKGLVEALKRIDYPAEQLDVMFLTEIGDHATQQQLQKQIMPAQWRILSLANGIPRTKPRALNAGLVHAKGQYVTVFDAEDRPHPGQLKAAIEAFQIPGAERLACVQAPLRAHNAGEGWITGQWALEYDVNFGLILPALARARLPIALGGTSNHFRIQALKAVGGWDAWNVTEDADLGLRFARSGWQTSVISLPTLEEAPEHIRIWTAQRSRWIKGYMQTWCVLMRQPLQTTRQMGLRGFVSTQILLGGAILSALLHGPLALWCLACLLVPGLGMSAQSLAVLVLGYAVSAMAALLAPRRGDLKRLSLICTFPLYWPLLSISALRALFEMVYAPYRWAKTPHGLTAHRPGLDLTAFV